MACLGGGEDFLVGGVGFAHADVVADASLHQPGVLQNHAELLTEHGFRHAADVGAVNRQNAGIDVVEAHQKVNHCRFATAGRADQGNLRAGLHINIQIANQRSFRPVGKCDVLRRYASLRNEIGDILQRGLFPLVIKHFEDASGAGERVLQLRDDAGDFVERLRILSGITEQSREASDREPSGEHKEGTDHRDNRVNGIVDDTGARVRQGREEGGLQGGLRQAVIDLAERSERLVFVRESGHNLAVSDHFVNQTGLFASNLGLRAEQMVGLPGDELRKKQRGRRQNDNHERDDRALNQHADKRSDNRHDARKELGKSHQQSVGELIHIGNHAAHKVAVVTRVDVGNRHAGNLGEQFLTNLAHNPEGDGVVNRCRNPGRHGSDGNQNGTLKKYRFQGIEVDISLADDDIDSVADENRDHQRADDGNGGKQQRQKKQPLLASDIAEQAFNGIFLHAASTSFRGKWRRNPLIISFFMPRLLPSRRPGSGRFLRTPCRTSAVRRACRSRRHCRRRARGCGYSRQAKRYVATR